MTRDGRPRHRFALSLDAVSGGEVRFPAAIARQMRRVLRLGPGDRVAVFAGQGVEYEVSLTAVRDQGAIGSIEAEIDLGTEPGLKINLGQALLPREKFEHVLQKGTEVGVSAFIPLVTERSLVPARSIDASRLERWRRILAEAAEQSGRAIVPELQAPRSLAELLSESGNGPILLAWEGEASRSIRAALSSLDDRPQPRQLTIVIGPEGGFTSAEALAVRAAGALTVSLGRRILRAETAGPLVAALALYQAGDLEPAR